jgi:hypothetical protein
MTIRVERCAGRFRLIDKFGHVEFITNKNNDRWDRSFAKMALDMYQGVYKYKRSNIRFYIN